MRTPDAHNTETIFTETSVLIYLACYTGVLVLARTGLIFAEAKGRARLGHGSCSIPPQVIAGDVGEGVLSVRANVAEEMVE